MADGPPSDQPTTRLPHPCYSLFVSSIALDDHRRTPRTQRTFREQSCKHRSRKTLRSPETGSATTGEFQSAPLQINSLARRTIVPCTFNDQPSRLLANDLSSPPPWIQDCQRSPQSVSETQIPPPLPHFCSNILKILGLNIKRLPGIQQNKEVTATLRRTLRQMKGVAGNMRPAKTRGLSRFRATRSGKE